MARVEKLPSGFERLPSQALRVRVRLSGHAPAIRTFPLFSESAEALREQLAEAKAWVEAARRDLLGGAVMPDRAALTTTLEDALKRFQRVGLKGKADNTKVEAYRIGTILADPIAQLPLSRIRKADIAAFRDRLVERGWS